MSSIKEIQARHDAKQKTFDASAAKCILPSQAHTDRGELLAMLEKIFHEADDLGSIDVWRVDEIMQGEK